MASVYCKETGIYYISVMFQNQRITRSLGTRSFKVARKLTPHIEKQILAELVGVKKTAKKTLSFPQLVSRYLEYPNHDWSIRTHTLYNMGQTGLPYEMIINSNPSIAYLMRENALYIHILTMAHCVGHSDFFKNNRMFNETNPDNIIDSFIKQRILEIYSNRGLSFKKFFFMFHIILTIITKIF